MADREVRIGSLPDVFHYDDADFDSAIDTDHFIKSSQAPAVNDDMVRLQDLNTAVANAVQAAAVITDHAIVRGDGGVRGIQDSGIIIDDLDNISGITSIIIDGLLAAITSGAIEYSNGRLYMTNKAHRRAIDRTSDVAVATVTVENTLNETALWMGTMAANSLEAGNIFKFHADGIIQNGGPTANDRVTLRIRVGGITGAIVTTLNPVAGAIAVGSHWHIDANATQRTLGVAGSRSVHIDLDVDGTILEVIGLANIDTTANMDVVITAQWASANVNNIISLYQGFMEYKN